MNKDDTGINEGYTTLSDMRPQSGGNETIPEWLNDRYAVIGWITVIFGILAGLVVFVTLLDTAQTPVLGFGIKQALGGKQVFWGFMVSLGVSLLFIVPGTICIGIGKILEWIEKDTVSDNSNLSSEIDSETSE